jgi:hypothetical protein
VKANTTAVPSDGEALAAVEMGADRQAQRRSWAIGELMLRHPALTRAEAEAIVEQAAARLAAEDA